MNSQPLAPVWRVDQVGSLLRPAEVRDAFARHSAGDLGDAELRQVQDEAIRQLISKEESVGLPVVTDGEFRRQGFMESFSEVAGWDLWGHFTGPLPAPGQTAAPTTAAPATTKDPTIETQYPATERLRLVKNRPLEEYQFSSSVATRPIKITLITTDRMRSLLDLEASRSVYPDIQTFESDLVRIEREIVTGLVDAGCRYVQIDGPSYTRFVDPIWRQFMHERGEDAVAVLRESIDADNAVIDGLSGATFSMHLCRGNPADGGFHRQGAYDEIADLLFNGLKHSRLLLEYDTERAGTFEPLRFLPKGKTVVLGLVSTKMPEVETVEYLKRRIDDAAKFAPLDQLAISPQCGFASGIGHNRLTQDQQWRKFEVLVETAQQVWG